MGLLIMREMLEFKCLDSRKFCVFLKKTEQNQTQMLEIVQTLFKLELEEDWG